MSSLEISQYLPTLSIITTATFVVATPIYILGFVRFIRNRQHIIIAKRFPVLCVLMSLSSFLSAFLLAARFWIERFHEHPLPQLSAGVGFIAYGLVNLRLYLILVRHTQSQNLLQHLRRLSNRDVLQTSRKSSEATPTAMYCSWSCTCLCLFIVIGGCWIGCGSRLLPSYYAVIGAAVWMSQIVTMLVLLIMVRVKRVKDGIGCLRETILILIALSVVAVISPLAVIHEKMVIPVFVLFSITSYMQGAASLYGGLYYVRKMHLLNAKISNEIEQPLHAYLQKYENYCLLRDYMCVCWAGENLLFLQNVAIINQLVRRLKQQQHQPQTEDSVSTTDSAGAAAAVALNTEFEFAYLVNLYKEYSNAILGMKMKTTNAVAEFDDVKENVFSVYQKIYFNFVALGSKNEINISYKYRMKLIQRFEHEAAVDSFHSFDDFLCLYDHAMFEIINLVQAMYCYNFRQYVRKNIESNNMDFVTTIR